MGGKQVQRRTKRWEESLAADVLEKMKLNIWFI